MITIRTASTDSHLKQIMALQHRYSAQKLTPDQQQAEGFVFVKHTLPLLKRMTDELPQAVALADDRVVGYCLAFSLSQQASFPRLQPMFDQFSRSTYEGEPLTDYRFFIGGQVCVDRAYRGQGLLSRLYHHIGQSLSSDYDLCITEIATRNKVSVHAHEKMGFEPISTYADDQEQWIIVAWDLGLIK